MELVKSITGLAKGAQMCVPQSNVMFYVIAGTTLAILVASVIFWDKFLPTKSVAA